MNCLECEDAKWIYFYRHIESLVDLLTGMSDIVGLVSHHGTNLDSGGYYSEVCPYCNYEAFWKHAEETNT